MRENLWVEYGLIAAAIAVVIIGAVQTLGTQYAASTPATESTMFDLNTCPAEPVAAKMLEENGVSFKTGAVTTGVETLPSKNITCTNGTFSVGVERIFRAGNADVKTSLSYPVGTVWECTFPRDLETVAFSSFIFTCTSNIAGQPPVDVYIRAERAS